VLTVTPGRACRASLLDSPGPSISDLKDSLPLARSLEKTARHERFFGKSWFAFDVPGCY